MKNIKLLFFGVLFGILLTKSQVISWFRIQEMFRFHDIYMYGIIGLAILVGLVSILIIKKLNIKTVYNEPITFQPKSLNKGTLFGGMIFGLGWALTGACPGPLYALIGNGFTVIIVALLSALLGVWIYGFFRKYIPH